MTKKGILEASPEGEFTLWEKTGPPWGGEFVQVKDFRPTNALLPAIARAQTLGYEDVGGEW